jgi:hypothetical protein
MVLSKSRSAAQSRVDERGAYGGASGQSRKDASRKVIGQMTGAGAHGGRIHYLPKQSPCFVVSNNNYGL